MKLVHLVLLAAVLAGCGGDAREAATVPDMRGLDLEAARDLLLDAGLVHERLRCRVAPDFAVVAQLPRPGAEVALGTSIALRLEQVHGSGIAPPAGGWPRCESAGFQ
jgi:hypothetical protein